MDEALQFLEHLTPADVNWLLDHCESRTVLAEQTLVAAGCQPESLYFVSQGQFDVFVPGVPVRVNRLQRGALIGEVSWIDAAPATATVKASESGEVLALPIEELDAELGRSPAMAARFNAAIARLLASRLRRATNQLAREEGSVDLAGALPAQLGELLADFKSSMVATDKRLREAPDAAGEVEATVLKKFEHVWRTFDSVMRAITNDQQKELIGSIAQRELLPYVLLASTAERFYSKPRGYAGDYLTIQQIYDNVPLGVGRLGPLIDRGCLDQPAARAVSNRRGLLAGLIAETLARSPDRPVHITSLACGPGREIFDVFDGSLGDEARRRLFVTALDIDAEALASLQRRVEEAGLSSNIELVRANLVHISTGRQTIDQPPQDLIYSIGLIDYFADRFVVQLMDWIHGQLRPGGRAVLGNFAPENPARAFMDYVLDWRLIHRSPSDMDRLYRQSRFGRETTRVLFENEKINLFAECERLA